jgi:hypothetical protein
VSGCWWHAHSLLRLVSGHLVRSLSLMLARTHATRGLRLTRTGTGIQADGGKGSSGSSETGPRSTTSNW